MIFSRVLPDRDRMNILKAQTIVKLPNVGCCNFMSRSLRVLFLLDFVSIPFYFVFLANSPRLRLKLFASSFQFILKSNPSQICSYNLHPSLKSLLLTLYLSISLSLYLSLPFSSFLFCEARDALLKATADGRLTAALLQSKARTLPVDCREI